MYEWIENIMASNVTMASLTNSSTYSTHSSKTIEIASAKTLPLMDELAQVNTPQLTSTIVHRLFGATYVHYVKCVKHNLNWISILSQHLVPDAYPFPKFI